MRIIPVPMLSDNYSYLLVDNNGITAAVDPVEPAKAIEAAKKENLQISKVLTTHHHWDHAGGNEEISKLIPGIEIVGGEHDNVSTATKQVANEEEITLGDIKIKCLETPFHTLGHICYMCEEGTSERNIFTGDTLFVAGCGRCFAGTPEQMYHSLIDVLSHLPGDVKVWCGHEYTVQNLKFAAAADKDNKAVLDKLEWAKAQREKGLPTIPSTIEEELRTNPFLRISQPQIIEYTGGSSDPVRVLAALRQKKDRF
ncbi:g6575 [Coccomyxa elongata]